VEVVVEVRNTEIQSFGAGGSGITATDTLEAAQEVFNTAPLVRKQLN
jgi:hypothetical protein